jgi:hypothetical protein
MIPPREGRATGREVATQFEAGTATPWVRACGAGQRYSHRGYRAENIARTRELLNAPVPQNQTGDPDAIDGTEPRTLSHPCPCCGGRMIIIETFQPGCSPRTQPADSIRIDTP